MAHSLRQSSPSLRSCDLVFEVGYWIDQDLMAALSTLKWTTAAGENASAYYRIATERGLPSCATVLSDTRDEWDARSWLTGAYGGAMYRMAAAGVDNAGAGQDEYAFYSGRAKGTFSVDVVTTALACSCDVYLLPQLTWAGTTFDSDYGTMAEGELWAMHATAGQWVTLASSQAATRTTSLIGDFDTFTPDLHGINCSNLDERGCQVDVDGCHFILKWTFTNSD